MLNPPPAPSMPRRLPGDAPLALWDHAALRRIEHAAAAALPPYTLMARAGDALARLLRARWPHAQRVVVLCGPGNNGGDGMVAAARLRACGVHVEVGLVACGDARAWDQEPNTSHSPDWHWALQQARAADVQPLACDGAAAARLLEQADVALDALLGIGLSRAPQGELAGAIEALNAAAVPVLAADVPSGLDAATGAAPGPHVRATATLSLLGAKPGLFSGPQAHACGELWFDDLGVDAPQAGGGAVPCARLNVPKAGHALPALHTAAHKGARGDVQVFGGSTGMTGAALLAARSALALGAGRVFAGLLDPHAPTLDLQRPELMLRDPATLKAAPAACIVFGPGAGTSAPVAELLTHLLVHAQALVVDADGLNLLAAQPRDGSMWTALRVRAQPAWLTPHPREAAALLETSVAAVQADRLGAARALAELAHAHCVLKGAGSVIATCDGDLWVNPSGNGLLATAGSGDVLAGALGAALARTHGVAAQRDAVRATVWLHGAAADAALLAGALPTAGDLPGWMQRVLVAS